MSIREVPIQERDSMLAHVAMMRRNLPAMLEMLAIDAQMRRAKYNALIKEGFSDQQALELCKGTLL